MVLADLSLGGIEGQGYPGQLLVFGRGSGELTDVRADAASIYYERYQPHTVVFAGSTSHLNGDTATTAEADVMADRAGLPPGVERRARNSNSTAQNLIEAAGYFDLREPIALLAHAEQMAHIRLLARPAFGRYVLEVPVEDFGFEPEPPSRAERLHLIATRALYLGLPEGNLERFAHRERKAAHAMHAAGVVLGPALRRKQQYHSQESK